MTAEAEAQMKQLLQDAYDRGRSVEREACAKLIECNSEFGDCEALGTMDPETGVKECGARDCLCEPRIEHGEKLAALVRART